MSHKGMKRTVRPNHRVASVYCFLHWPPVVVGPRWDTTALNGVVRDVNGGVLRNAIVIATNRDAGIERRTKTNTSGVYMLPDLPVGNYTVVFSADGFCTVRYKDVIQSVGGTRTLNPVLAVSGVRFRISHRGSYLPDRPIKAFGKPEYRAEGT